MAADDQEQAIAVGYRLLADRLRSLREEAGLTQRELAATAGIAYESLRSIEVCRRMPTLSTLLPIATALGTTPRDLLEGIYPWDGGNPPG